MVAAVALLWCHGGYVQAHEGSLATPTTVGGPLAIHAPTPAPAMMTATGCAFAAKSVVTPGGTPLRASASSPDGPRAAVSPPALPFDPPQAVRLAAGTAPYHASLVQQAVLIRI